MLPSLPPPSDALKHADAKLRPLMQSLRDRLTDRTPDLASIKGSLVALLEYLSSAIGCTDSNCRAVASFFWLDDEWPMELLPEDFQEVFAHMDSLDDTVSASQTAQNFDSTPEQLLQRARLLNI